MTVKELIEKLKEMPQDVDVYYWNEDDQWFNELEAVRIDSDGEVNIF